MSWPCAQPNPDPGPDDHQNTEWEDDQDVFQDAFQDVFRSDEKMVEEWTEICNNRIICLGVVDMCITEAINLEAVPIESPLPPLTIKKVSEYPVPPPKAKSMRGAALEKANFLKAMDKTYFSIRNLKDIIEVEEPASSPTISKYAPSLPKIVQTRPTPARTKLDPLPTKKSKNQTKQSNPPPPSKQPAWKVELAKTMKTKKKTEKSLQTPKLSDKVQVEKFKKYFTSSDVKVTNFTKKTDFKTQSPSNLNKAESIQNNTNFQKNSKVGSLLKMFEKKKESE